MRGMKKEEERGRKMDTESDDFEERGGERERRESDGFFLLFSLNESHGFRERKDGFLFACLTFERERKCLRLVRCKMFSECKIFSIENILRKGKHFFLFGCVL